MLLCRQRPRDRPPRYPQEPGLELARFQIIPQAALVAFRPQPALAPEPRIQFNALQPQPATIKGTMGLPDSARDYSLKEREDTTRAFRRRMPLVRTGRQTTGAEAERVRRSGDPLSTNVEGNAFCMPSCASRLGGLIAPAQIRLPQIGASGYRTVALVEAPLPSPNTYPLETRERKEA